MFKDNLFSLACLLNYCLQLSPLSIYNNKFTTSTFGCLVINVSIIHYHHYLSKDFCLIACFYLNPHGYLLSPNTLSNYFTSWRLHMFAFIWNLNQSNDSQYSQLSMLCSQQYWFTLGAPTCFFHIPLYLLPRAQCYL